MADSRALVAICQSELEEKDLNRYKDHIKTKIRAIENQRDVADRALARLDDLEKGLEALKNIDPTEWAKLNPQYNYAQAYPTCGSGDLVVWNLSAPQIEIGDPVYYKE